VSVLKVGMELSVKMVHEEVVLITERKLAICTNSCVNGDCVAPDQCSCYAGWSGPLCDEPGTTG
jgi:hypothetical protein